MNAMNSSNVEGLPASPASLARVPSDDADVIPASWFEPRRSSLLGDDLADAWLR